jgi:SanA protein
MRKFLRDIGNLLFITWLVGPPVFLMGIILADLWVSWMSVGRTYNDTDALPYFEVGLVLGTSRYTIGGGENSYFTNRMLAAQEAYHTGKINHLLLSGDNRHRSYNEPQEMQKALLGFFVPPDAMTLDYAGFRTFDSVIRAKKVFQQDRLVVISQQFHNERAIAIGKFYDIDMIGLNAADLPIGMGLRLQLRELGARLKLVFDLMIGAQPKFLGQPIPIPKS